MLRIVKNTPEAVNVKPLDKALKPFDSGKAVPKKALEVIKIDIKPTKPAMDPEADESMEAEPEMVETGKIDQASVHYLTSDSICGNCKHWLEPGGCDVVSGEISYDGICMLWSKGDDPRTEDAEDEEPVVEDDTEDEDEPMEDAVEDEE